MKSETTVDVARLDQLLLAVEATAHRAGWDGPPRLMLLVDLAHKPDVDSPVWTPPVRAAGYAAVDVLPSAALAPNAAHGLFRVARSLARLPTGFVADVFGDPKGVLGVAVLYEAYGRSGVTEEERKALQGKPLADIPGSLEMRCVCAATMDGAVAMAQRIRGKEPKILKLGDGKLEGAVFESLRTITAVLGGRTVDPTPQWLPTRWAR